MELVKKRVQALLRRWQKRASDIARNPACAELEVDNWELSEFVAYELVPIVGVHPFPLTELSLMAAAVASLKPTHIFEWGTYLGKSARIFFESSRRFGVGTAIYSVDLPEDVDHVEHPHQRRGMFVRECQGVTLLTGDGLETSLRLCRDLRREQGATKFNPLFFVDGDHDYSSVRRELEGIIETAPEAHILLHDTFFQSPGSNYNTGPYRAIKDVLSGKEGYKVISQELGLPGMTLLFRK